MLTDEEFSAKKEASKINKAKRKQKRKSFYMRHVPLLRRSKEWWYSYQGFHKRYIALSQLNFPTSSQKVELRSCRWCFWGTIIPIIALIIGASIWIARITHHVVFLWLWTTIPIGLVIMILIICYKDAANKMFKNGWMEKND